MKKVPRVLLLTTLPLLAGVPPSRGEAAVAPSGLPSREASLLPSGTTARAVETALLRAAPTMRPEALRAALSAWETLQSRGELSRARSSR